MELAEKIQLAEEITQKRRTFTVNDDFHEFLVDCYLILTPQSYGAKINKEIVERGGFEKVKPKDDQGDCAKNGKFAEIKASYLSTTNSWNLIQLRPYQNFDYYIFLLIDNLDNFTPYFFVLHKSDLDYFQVRSIHGTEESNKDNQNIEYKLTVYRESKEFELLSRLNLIDDNSLEGVINFFDT